MHRLDWYLDTAKERLKLPSDRQLAPHLDVTDAAISQYRTKRSWPRGVTMVKLAAICDVPPDLALAELGSWKEPEVLAWRALVERLKPLTTALVVALAVFFGDGDGGAQAAQSANIAPPGHSSIYIMRQIGVRWGWSAKPSFRL